MALLQNGALERRFLSFINREQLFDQTDCILLTISGGLDSVVMAELFRSAGLRYGMAHVNFQLRGAESEGDEAFVKELAEQHGVRFHTVRLAAKNESEAQGISTQMAARKLRYDWFEQVAEEFDYARIATAHHQDDVLETILLNLVRGTGLTGLKGVPVRQGRIIRPLWFADRTMIEAYAQNGGIRWREDSSNASDKYHRNRLRHQVVPVLKEINPNLLETLQTTVARLRSADALVDAEIRRSWEKLAEMRPEGIFLSIEQLLLLEEWEYRLAEWLKPYGFQYAQLGDMAETVRADGFGQQFYSATHLLIRDRDYLMIKPRQAAPAQTLILDAIPATTLNVFGQYELYFELIPRSGDFQIPVDSNIACLDAERIQWPLTIRIWQNGDRFRPLGVKGHQTVGNFLTNRKVTIAERQSARVLVSGDRIAWLVGYRPDDYFRITDQTRTILKIERRFPAQR
ncbi:tRNA(Ile)-lysidine synthase [Larkinella arboricola]|uniref:tRNA(Ile)-lysidine synthase n=1 Tax=Larkinella arboricola TaxID=643671 RepID=A0A327X111_LARAB|nr:tRNA lysidine(34) synthetase TilS [Larkinella arboricola]RAJ99819.1 tRNA(Ile)-lysidine synthase [Larkinella arboricola]